MYKRTNISKDVLHYFYKFGFVNKRFCYVPPPSLNLSSRSFLLWGTGTSIGKTFIASVLALDNYKTKVGLKYIKPVQTGFPESSDSHAVARAVCGTVHLSDHAKMLYPQYKEPKINTHIQCHTLFAWKSHTSPHLAIQKEGRRVSDNEIIKELAKAINEKTNCKFTIIETAGGVCSPAPSGNLLVDIFRPLRMPCILVGDSNLGGISATLSAYESLLLRGYEVCAIIMFQNNNTKNDEYIDKQTLRHLHWVGFQRPITLIFPAIPFDDSSTSHDNKIFEEWFDSAFYPVEALRQVIYNKSQRHFDRLAASKNISISHFLWPFTQHKTLEASSVNVVDSRCGQFLSIFENFVKEDTLIPQKTDGILKPMFDASASWWTQGVEGDAQFELSKAVAFAAGRYGHILFPEVVHEPVMRCTQKLLQTVVEKWASRVFYSDDGSTAVEVAIKMALRKYQMTFKKRINNTDDLHILGFSNCYHGDTLGAMQTQPISSFNKFQTPWYRNNCACMSVPQLIYKNGEWHLRIPGNWPIDTVEDITELKTNIFNKYTFERDSEIERKLNELYIHYLNLFIDQYEEASMMSEKRIFIGACIMEPVLQGAGGMILVDPIFQRAVSEVCNKRDIPLIFDEVLTGFWRIGALNGAKLLGKNPDIACYGKLLTGGIISLGVTLASDDIFEAFLGNSKEEALLHGHSYTANPISCVAAITTMNIFTAPRFNQNLISKRDENRTLDIIPDTFNKLPGLLPQDLRLQSIWNKDLIDEISNNNKVEGVTVIGTLFAITLKSNNKNEKGYMSILSKPIVDKLKKKGILTRPLGNVIYLMVIPSTSREICDWLLSELKNALENE